MIEVARGCSSAAAEISLNRKGTKSLVRATLLEPPETRSLPSVCPRSRFKPLYRTCSAVSSSHCAQRFLRSSSDRVLTLSSKCRRHKIRSMSDSA